METENLEESVKKGIILEKEKFENKILCEK